MLKVLKSHIPDTFLNFVGSAKFDVCPPFVYALDSICLKAHIAWMWEVLFHEDFDEEFEDLSAPVKDEMLAQLKTLSQIGPQYGRPRVDTLKGSRYSNLKELRFNAGDGVWRVAFAFDPARKAVLLVAGDKSGVGEKRFYRQLIEKADARFAQHLARVKAGKTAERKKT